MQEISQHELDQILDYYNRNGMPVNLSGLKGSFLSFAYKTLNKSNFEESNFTNCNFRGCCLSKANFSKARLVGSSFYGCAIRKSNFEGANLNDAIFVGSCLRRSSLNDVMLWEAVGNGYEIKSINVFKYPITYTIQTVQIGCENHTLEEWENFSEEEINKMDSGALDFWKKNKEIIINMIKHSPAEG